MSVVPPARRIHLDEREPRWFAIYTKYKREKIVDKRLKERGIHSYVPLQKFTRQWTRKVKTVELPLISCYVFAKITKKEYVSVLETQDVVNFVKVSKDLIAIPEPEMEVLRKVVGEGIDVELEPHRYQLGDEVEVVSGRLTGLKGKLVSKDGNRDLVIELKNIGYSLRMQVNPAMLRKVG